MSKSETKRKGKFLHKFGAAVVALVLVAAMVVGLTPSNTTFAAEYLADLNTTTKYSESLGDNASTEYAGRIWTDKSVFEEDAVFTGYSGSSQTIEKGDADFLISLSALATSQSISGQAQTPLDVVFVIDMSGSMRQNSMDNGKTRMANTIAALNSSVEALLATSPQTRVGVVAFSGEAYTLLELDHYTKLENQSFFSTNSDESRIYTKAVGATKGTINTTTVTSSGTNIQRGIHDGLAMLLNVTDTTVVVDGQTVKRAPSVILLSDGAPTIASSFETWWDLSQDNGNYDYDTERPLYAMQTIMTASYMKDAIDRHYQIDGTAYSTKVYSIGMGIQQISGENRNIASIAIDPANHINANNNTAKTIREAWEEYCSNGHTGTPTLEAKKEGADWWGNGGTQTYYTFKHPNTGYDIDSINYVDQYYNADNTQAVTDVFDSIVSSISISAPQIPTEHDAENPMTSGYITFTDPIGEYMEVKDFKAIIYAGKKYEAHTVSTTGSVTTYTFTETAEGNAVYGSEELNHIIIEVTSSTNADGAKAEVLTVKIPASLIPIRVNTIELNKDDTVKTHTNNGAYPIRILYTVGLQDEVKSGDNIALEELSSEYIAKHSNADGSINFYSNLYTGTNVVNGAKAGDTTAVFDPATTNPFYYMQKDQILYKDINCTQRVDVEELDPEATYYYKETYYHGTQVVTEATERTGAQLTGNTTVVKATDAAGTYWYRPAGTVRVNRMLEFEGTKSANATNTADDFYAPTYDGSTGHFKVYLGNNGVMSVKATGTLEFTKTVTADQGLTAPDASFTFTVNLTDESNAPLTGTYAYTVADANGHGIHEGTITNGGKITLKAGHTSTIVNLPPNAKYTLTESKTPGFTATEEVINGSIVAGQVTSETFANHYKVEKLTFPASSGLSGTKVLVGRDWAEGDTFTFAVSPYNNAPLPEHTEVTVTTATDNRAEFNFGSIEFTKPGVYRYTVVEKEPASEAYLPGMSYSRALYRLVVTVVDDGDGTLSATSDLQRLYTDDATPLFTYDTDNNIVMNSGEEGQDQIVFTNTYSAASVVRVPVASKDYTDLSGGKPLVSGMFKFKLSPLGYVDANGDVVAGTASVNPMPVDELGNKLTEVITENEGHNVTFLPVTFTQADLLDGKTTTYRYQVEEVVPTPALPGMTYDTDPRVIDVVLSIDPDSDTLIVDSSYSSEVAVAAFTNKYDPVDAKATIEGLKVLTGRDLNAGEFSFVLTDADGNEVETVTNAADGKFSFAELTFDKVGTYTYSVTETKGTLGGITYDEHVCAVTINVTDNNGTLVADVVYSDGNTAVFNNTYEATFDPETAINLAGTKELTGRPIEAGEFFFEVSPQNGAPMGAKATYEPAEKDDTPSASGVYEGAITFLTDVVFTEAGTYKYVITEVIPTDSEGNVVDNGVTYDTSEYVVTVKVTDDLKGTLSAAITSITKDGASVIDIVFKNSYAPDDVVYIFRGAQKVLTGERYFDLKAGEFEFIRTATPTDGIHFYKADDPATAEDESLIEVGVSGEDVVANAADGSINFGNIKFTKVGIYVVTIKEVVPSTKLPGVTYDESVTQATFVVTDDLEGELHVTITGIQGSQVFTNEYKTTGTLEGATNLNVTKVLDVTERAGKDTWSDGDKFTFVLEAADTVTTQAVTDGKVVLPTVTSIEIGKPADDGNTNSKAFDDIKFYAVGTYTFRIREIEGTELGMDYDVTPRTITVVTTDNGDGTLTVTASGETNPTFKNKYNVNDVVLPGHGNLHVNKVFTGRQNDEWLATDVFNFTLDIDANDAPTKEAYEAGEIQFAEGGKELAVTKDNKDVAHFGNITFGKAGTYKFVIKETKGSIAGVTYDADLDRNVTVVVSETEEVDANGAKFLTVAIDYNNSEADANKAFTFTNKYDTEDVALSGETVLGVSKEISGRDWMSGDVFTFTLTAASDVTKAAIESDKVILGGDDTLTSLECSIDAEGEKAVFAPITFTEPGSYIFYVREAAGSIEGITYDQHVATIDVKVIDNNKGALEISLAENSGNMTWTNTYTPAPITESLEGVKVLEGRELLDTDKFTFAISAGNDLAKLALPEKTEVTNNGSEIKFGEMTFTQEGVYVYFISERTVNSNGLTSDTGYVKATVEVKYDASTGELSIPEGNITYEKVHPVGEETGFTFVNRYETVGRLNGATNLNVTKHFLGRANNDWLQSDSFEFKLAAGNEATATAIADGIVTLPENATGITINHNDVNKVKAFGDILFTKAGQYQFVITETVPTTKNGITYDSDVERTIIVNVVDNLDGTLTATVEKATSESLVFTNTYDVEETTLIGATNLVVEKLVSGREWLTDDTYSFTLEADMSHSATASAINAADPIIVMNGAKSVTITSETEGHKAAFGDIIFKEAGAYRFLVKEVIPSDANKISGITYDSTIKHVNVIVKDNNDGTLTAAVEVATSEPLVFANVYTTKAAVVALNGTKTMVGRDLMDTDKFEFTISAVTAYAPMPAETTVVNTVDGKIAFGNITFTAPGEYKYQIKEKDTTIPGVTKDGHTVDVTVTVTDNKYGQLVAEVVYGEGGFAFVNTYKADPIYVSVVADKKVTATSGNNYAMTGGEFTFEIDAAESNPASDPVKHTHVQNTPQGVVTFINSAKYTEAGTYVYTVHEEVSGQTGITYDGSVYRIEVKVTDNLDGTLSAQKTLTKNGEKVDAIVFENKYDPHTTSALIHGHKRLVSEHKSELEAGLFQFKLEAITAGAPMPANAIATNTAAGLFQFDAITYENAGTFEYRITEVKGSAPGYIYDETSAYTVTVEVVDKAGFLQATVKGLANDKDEPIVVFTNGYVPSKTTLAGIAGHKTLTGHTLEANEFSFVLTDADGNVIETVKNDADGNFAFGSLEFTKAGTYYYTIKEDTTNAIGGITFDKTEYTVKVDVTDVDGALTAKATYLNGANTVDAIEFVNSYDTTDVTLEGEEVLGVSKAISGRGWLAGDVFKFELTAADSDTTTAVANDTVLYNKDAALESLTCEIKYADSSKTSVFAPITFKEPGTYTFNVKEVEGELAGVAYDKHVTTITVKVEDNGLGALVITSTATEGSMTWTNGYTPAPITASLQGTKTIRGREMKADDVFEFVIAAANELAETAMPANTVVKNNGSQIKFGEMSFAKAGIYEYTISEKAFSANGITSDPGYVKATVNVSYDASTGKLEVASISYEKVGSRGEGFRFINEYRSEGFLDGSTHLNVTKHFTGRANDTWLAGDSFKFTLTIDSNHVGTAEALKHGYITLPANAAGITITSEDLVKEKAFGNIRFTEEGTYQFIVSETTPASGFDKGITYDKAPQRIILVHVTDKLDGTLAVTVDQSSELLVFTNKYDTVETTLEGATNLVVEKVIEGRDWITEDTYNFTLEADMTHIPTADALKAKSPIIVMPEADEVTITKDTPDHKAAFGDILFRETGTYRFLVKETTPAEHKIPGVAYDHDVKQVTVHVVDNHDGTMTASVVAEHSEALTFVNKYSAAPTTATLHANKVMNGRELKATDKFEFTIEAATAGAPMPAETTVVNAEDGTIAFAPIPFKAVGTYEYTITETGGKAPGVTNATNVVKAKVEVVDNKLGHLVATVTYEDGNTFTNVYQEAPSAPVTVVGTKSVVASAGNSYNLEAGKFKFEIEPAESNPERDPIKDRYTVSNTAEINNNITFINGAVYTEEGTYFYTVHEEDNALAGITYDDTVYRIKVDVKDVEDIGQLVATVTMTTADGNAVSAIEFVNGYDPLQASALIHGHKVLVSEHKSELEAGLFEFKLEAVSGTEMVEGVETEISKEEIPMPASNIATNTAAGIFQFGTITYDKVGTYKYQITEVKGNTPGYTYSDAKYEVIVEVVDENGELKATTTGIMNGENPIVVFKNGYAPAATTVTLNGQKTLSGRALEFGEFRFVLADNNDNVVEAVNNDEKGNFQFGTLKFTKAGTYYYSIKEDTEDRRGGVTYDDTIYAVKIEVTDKGGSLEASVSYSAKGVVQESVVFYNTYKAAPTSKDIYVMKTISGRGLNAGEFEFVLKHGDNVLQRKKNDVNGMVAFDAIEYSAVGEYVYTIAEVKGDKMGVTYDANTFTVTVTVTDDLEGQLVAAVKRVDNTTGHEVEQVTFKNAYIPAHTSITLTGTKKLVGKDLVDGEFTFLLMNDKDEVVAKATNKADGTITFDELTFNTVGTFTYKVVEDSSAAAEGIVYDAAEYEVVVTVTDDLKGKLVATVEKEDIIFNNKFTTPNVKIQKLQAVAGGNATIENIKVAANDVVTYTIVLTNEGNGAAKNLVVTDKVPAGLELVVGSLSDDYPVTISEDGMITWTISRLEAGAQTSVSFQAKVPYVDEDQVWKNVATVVYDNNPDNPDTPEDPKNPENSNEVEAEGLTPEVAINKTQKVNDGKATKEVQTVNAGDKVTYILTVTNNGEAEALKLTINDKVPTGLELVAGSVQGADAFVIGEDGTIEWTLANLAVGASAEVSFAVKVPAVVKETSWINVATVVYDNNPDNPDDPNEPDTPVKSNEVEIKEFTPSVEISKAQKVNLALFATEEKQVVRAGDTVTYIIKVTNTGKGQAQDLVITDEVPAGLILDASSISENGTVEGNVITWKLATLDAGQTIKFRFRVTVPEVEEDTVWTNVATVVYGNNPENPTESEDPTTPDPLKPVISNEVEVQEDVVGSPITGDAAQTVIWIMAAITSLLAGFGIVIRRRREQN